MCCFFETTGWRLWRVEPEGDRTIFSTRCVLWIALGIWILAGIFQAIGAIRLNSGLQSGDQGAYLALSLAQKEARYLTDGNRHPLYSALLIPLAERTPLFFANARWVSFAIGLSLILILVFREVRSRANLTAAIVAAAFFSSHVQMVRTLSEIWCEGLLYLLLFLLWSSCESNHSKCGIDTPPVRTNLLFVFTFGQGCLAGLLYLTKGTGLQIAALFWLVLYFYSRSKRLVLLSLFGFLLTSLPLLVWNLEEYGKPFYNFASTHNMWFDEADEIWYENPEQLPTLATYLQTHTTRDILSRLINGLWLEAQMILQLLWSDWRLPEGTSSLNQFYHTLAKCIVFFFLAIGLLSRRCHPSLTSPMARGFFVALCIGLIPSFGWYAQLTNEPRFLMSLVPVGVVLGARLAADGIVSFRTWFNQRSGGSGFPPWMRVMGIAGCVAWAASGCYGSLNFLVKTGQAPPPRVPELAAEILGQVSRLPPDSTIAFGPSHELPTWLARGDLKWRATPWSIDFQRFEAMLERERIRYVLVDRETAARRPYLGPLVLSPTAPAGWKLIYRTRDPEGFFLLYEKE